MTFDPTLDLRLLRAAADSIESRADRRVASQMAEIRGCNAHEVRIIRDVADRWEKAFAPTAATS